MFVECDDWSESWRGQWSEKCQCELINHRHRTEQGKSSSTDNKEPWGSKIFIKIPTNLLILRMGLWEDLGRKDRWQTMTIVSMTCQYLPQSIRYIFNFQKVNIWQLVRRLFLGGRHYFSGHSNININLISSKFLSRPDKQNIFPNVFSGDLKYLYSVCVVIWYCNYYNISPAICYHICVVIDSGTQGAKIFYLLPSGLPLSCLI